MDTRLKTIDTQEDFLHFFQALCSTAELAFNRFEETYKDTQPGTEAYTSIGYRKELSYLMSITFVITGLRGNYHAFRSNMIQSPFSVAENGTTYDQTYLYKMSDYFTYRFDAALATLERLDPEGHHAYLTVWKNF